ncbi:FemAB family XrtA/PEP-CTERM system-associated protein [Chlamydiota bacterium]
MQIVQELNSTSWNSYVQSQGHNLYFLYNWKNVIEKTFKHSTFYLAACDQDKVLGIVPLALFKSKLFGSFLVSIPFLNYGGIVADTEEARDLLLKEAVKIAKKNDCKFVELRNAEKALISGLLVQEKKVTFYLNTRRECKQLWLDIGPKVRNQVRKAEKEGCYTQIGGNELIADFYTVFARNMRDLGTPVYSKAFFQNIAREFPDLYKVFVVRRNSKPLAASFTLGYNGKLEVPWASSLHKYNKYCPNMLLYWKMIEYSSQNKFKMFDFGRCTKSGSTYHFKKQWGGREIQLHWQYWVKEGNSIPELNPNNPKYKLAIHLWKKLPLWLTKLIGPRIVRNIP